MTKKELTRAKEIFIKSHYIVNVNKAYEKEWKELNPPNSIIIEWVIEYVNSLFNEFNLLKAKFQIIDSSNKPEYFNMLDRLSLLFSLIMKYTSTYKLYNYYPEIFSIINNFKYDVYSLYSAHNINDIDHTYNFHKYLLSIDSIASNQINAELLTKSFSYKGLIPQLLSENKDNEAFELLNYIFDFIENAGYFDMSLIENLYYFSLSTNNKVIIAKAIDNIKKCKINYHALYPLWPITSKDILLDVKEEIDSLKNIYYKFVIECRLYKKIEKLPLDAIKKIEYVKHNLPKYNLEESILNKWNIELLDFLKNKLVNIEDYLSYDISFINSSHTKRYIDYLKNNLPSYKIYSMWLSYLILNFSNTSDIEIINNVLTKLEEYNSLNKLEITLNFATSIINSSLDSGIFVYNYDKNDTKMISIYLKLITVYVLSYASDVPYLIKTLINFSIEQKDEKLLSFMKELGIKKMLKGGCFLDNTQVLIKYSNDTNDNNYRKEIENTLNLIFKPQNRNWFINENTLIVERPKKEGMHK